MKPKSNQMRRLIDGVILKTTKNRKMYNSARKGMRKLVGTKLIHGIIGKTRLLTIYKYHLKIQKQCNIIGSDETCLTFETKKKKK